MKLEIKMSIKTLAAMFDLSNYSTKSKIMIIQTN